MPEPRLDSALPDPSPAADGRALRPPPSSWDAGSDRSHVKTFVLAASLMALVGLGALAAHADVAAFWRSRFGPPLTTEEMRERIGQCERSGDLACAQDTLAEL